ncbi:MAG TPA: aminoacyl-tRNA hydrolase [Anaerolineaceae bacterium]|nr:aminoacyl-tRNA hydrolase [Anaerolineaceae bacterium]
MTGEKHLIVGLGNPGNQHEKNRHNIGFMVVDALAKRWGISMKRNRKNALTGEGTYQGIPVVLAKPQTYMNNSGLSVGPLSRLYEILPENLLVIYDDLDLAFGRIRLRASGSAGGHHGMESIIEKASTSEFPRLRIGIGRPQHEGEDVIDFVLTGFHGPDKQKLKTVLSQAADAVETYLQSGIEIAMTQFNGVFLDEE